MKNYSYPALYSTDGEFIKVELPDLDLPVFYVEERNRAKLADITWNLVADYIEDLLKKGQTPPPSRKLEDLELSEDETRDAFLIELIGDE